MPFLYPIGNTLCIPKSKSGHLRSQSFSSDCIFDPQVNSMAVDPEFLR